MSALNSQTKRTSAHLIPIIKQTSFLDQSFDNFKVTQFGSPVKGPHCGFVFVVDVELAALEHGGDGGSVAGFYGLEKLLGAWSWVGGGTYHLPVDHVAY
jgi:hypothetical protein